MPSKSHRILVVEDEPTTAKLLESMLKKAGYTEFQTTSHVNEALPLVLEGKVDIVLLDWWLPEVEGIELLKKVKAEGKDTPIIMLTAECDKKMVMQAVQAGCFDYILKPVKSEKLIEKVDAACALIEGKGKEKDKGSDSGILFV